MIATCIGLSLPISNLLCVNFIWAAACIIAALKTSSPNCPVNPGYEDGTLTKLLLKAVLLIDDFVLLIGISLILIFIPQIAVV